MGNSLKPKLPHVQYSVKSPKWGCVFCCADRSVSSGPNRSKDGVAGCKRKQIGFSLVAWHKSRFWLSVSDILIVNILLLHVKVLKVRECKSSKEHSLITDVIRIVFWGPSLGVVSAHRLPLVLRVVDGLPWQRHTEEGDILYYWRLSLRQFGVSFVLSSNQKVNVVAVFATSGKAFPPAAEGKAFPPAAEGNAFPPAAEGKAFPPAAEGKAFPPAAEGKAFPPAAEGKAFPPAAEGKAFPPAAEGKAIPPAAEPWRPRKSS